MNSQHSDSEYHSQGDQSPRSVSKQNPNLPKPLNRDARSGSQRVKARRTRTGCLTCRARKIKCDETRGTCGNCARVMQECRWPVMRDVSATKSARISATNRGDQIPASIDSTRRPHHATCSACRIARCKCSRDHPSCSRCCEQDLVCDYGDNGDKSAPLIAIDVTPSSTGQSMNDPPSLGKTPYQTPESELERPRGQRGTLWTPSSIDQLPRHIIDQHLDAFFTYIYPCQANAFIHRSTLLRDVQSGRVNKKLLLAICAIASRFLPSDERPISFRQDSAQAQSWAREAKTMLVVEEMTTDTVATALLLAKYDMNSGKYGTAWMLSSIANRAALALGLHKEGGGNDSKMTWTERETRRRLMWACYCLDRMMATGVPEYVLIRNEHVRIQLPCEEHQYLLGIPCVTPVPNLEIELPGINSGISEQAERDIGMYGHYVQITGMRYMVLKCARNRNDDINQLPPWDDSSTFAQCVRKMSAWYSSLLPQFQLLPDTIYARQAQNQLNSLIMLHIWYDQCMSDLYRITLPSFPESLPSSMLLCAPTGWVEHQQLTCVRHARSIADTFALVASHIDMKKFTCLDTSLPLCVFESMRVQVQWLFMLPQEDQAENVAEFKERFSKLMGYVEKMRKHFPQAQWLLKEMRKTLLRHGIPICGGSESTNHDTSGTQTPNHPWLRRIHYFKHDSRVDGANETVGAMQMAFSNNEELMNPANAKSAMLDISNLNYDNNSVSVFPPPQNTESMPTNFPFGDELDMFGQDDMTNMLSGYDSGQAMPDMSGFLMSMFGDWTAKGFEDRLEL